MAGIVTILGANGRFGRAATTAFLDAGWTVKAAVRDVSRAPKTLGVTAVVADAFDAGTLQLATAGADVVVNALNPPYERWSRDLPILTSNVIQAAEASGATVMIPGNVYNYGRDMPPQLLETTPHAARTKKGRLRIEMEDAYAVAADRGVRTIILRGGDFIEQEKTGNWFDTYITAKAAKGKVTYPGPLDRVHAWAYLPDMARAMVGLAEKRADFAMFEEFGFEGFNLTGQELISSIEQAMERAMKVSNMPWPIMNMLAPVMPSLREVLEMRYLWDVPHAVDGAKLRQTLPAYVPTNLRDAISASLDKPALVTA